MASKDPTARKRAEAFFEERAADLIKSKGPVRVTAEAATAAADLMASDPDAWDVFATGVITEVVANRIRSYMARVRYSAVRGERFASRRARLSAAAAGDPPS